MPDICLDHLEKNKAALIHNIKPSDCQCRLLELGFLPGRSVEVVRKSPFGNTLYVRVNTGCIALRKNEASCICVKPI
ncbi:FeoA family protein [Membranihabitans maritimus]|uniref:FeoA family protein n=1 Tax=Membranihabitans maritimus TaxID=2904244 RepID=UPI0034E244B8